MKYYRALFKSPSDRMPWISSCLFKDELEAKNHAPGFIRMIGEAVEISSEETSYKPLPSESLASQPRV